MKRKKYIGREGNGQRRVKALQEKRIREIEKESRDWEREREKRGIHSKGKKE